MWMIKVWGQRKECSDRVAWTGWAPLPVWRQRAPPGTWGGVILLECLKCLEGLVWFLTSCNRYRIYSDVFPSCIFFLPWASSFSPFILPWWMTSWNVTASCDFWNTPFPVPELFSARTEMNQKVRSTSGHCPAGFGIRASGRAETLSRAAAKSRALGWTAEFLVPALPRISAWRWPHF